MPNDNEILKIKSEELKPSLEEEFPLVTNDKESLRQPYIYKTRMSGRRSAVDDLFTYNGFIAANATVTTVSNTTTETTLETFSLQSVPLRVGQVVRITTTGIYSTANATDTITVRVGSGGAPTTEWNSMVSTAATVTSQPWHLQWIGIIASLGTTGTMEAQMIGKINNINKDDPNTGTITINTDSTITIGITAQWSAAAVGNTISIRQFIIEIVN